LIAAGLLTLMALGRALDLGSGLTTVARRLAWSEGWYHGRRPLQAAVIFAIAVVGMVVAAVVVWRLRGRQPSVLVAARAVSMLVVLTAARLVSLHSLDRVLHRRLNSRVTVAAVMELGLLAVLVAAAVRATQRGDASRAGRRAAPPSRPHTAPG
jgi:hypothetical protein